MRKNIMSKKLKNIMLSFFTVSLVPSCVVPLVTSCSTQDVDVGGYDKQYKVDERMFRRLVKTSQINFRDKTMARTDISDEEKAFELDTFQKNFDSFINKFNSKNSETGKSINFTTKTNAVIDYMNNRYNIKVARDFGENPINWAFESEKIYSATTKGLKEKMIGMGLSSRDISSQLKSFQTKFNALSAQCYGQYADKLRSLIELKSQLISCADEVNNDLAFLAAHRTLSNFFKNHKIVIKNKQTMIENKIFWNNLNEDKKFTNDHKYNNDISDYVGKLFQVYDMQRDKYYDLDLKTTINGYIFIPTLKSMISKEKTNTYSFEVDWGLISVSNYHKAKTNPDKASVIYNETMAHTYKPTLSKSLDSSFASSIDNFRSLKDDDKVFESYDLPVTASFERQQLYNIYLKHIDFKWDDTKNPDKPNAKYPYCKFDCFVGSGSASEEPGISHLQTKELGEAGLCISYESPNKKQKTLRLNDFSSPSFHENDVGELFLRNCSVISTSKIIDDISHKVTNKLYACFNNSPYRSTVAKSDNINNESDHSKYVQIFSKKEHTNFDCEGFPISDKFSSKAFLYYRQIKDLFLEAKTNPYASTLNEAGPVYGTLIAIAAINSTWISIVCYKIFQASFKTAYDCSIFVLCIIFAGAMAALIIAFGVKCMDPLIKNYHNFQKTIKNSNFDEIIRTLDADAENCFADGMKYTKFKSLPFSQAMSAYRRYKTFNTNPLFRKYMASLNDSNVSPDQFLDGFKKDVQIFGSLYSATFGLTYIPLIMTLWSTHESFLTAKALQEEQEKLQAQMDSLVSEVQGDAGDYASPLNAPWTRNDIINQQSDIRDYWKIQLEQSIKQHYDGSGTGIIYENDFDQHLTLKNVEYIKEDPPRGAPEGLPSYYRAVPRRYGNLIRALKRNPGTFELKLYDVDAGQPIPFTNMGALNSKIGRHMALIKRLNQEPLVTDFHRQFYMARHDVELEDLISKKYSPEEALNLIKEGRYNADLQKTWDFLRKKIQNVPLNDIRVQNPKLLSMFPVNYKGKSSLGMVVQYQEGADLVPEGSLDAFGKMYYNLQDEIQDMAARYDTRVLFANEETLDAWDKISVDPLATPAIKDEVERLQTQYNELCWRIKSLKNNPDYQPYTMNFRFAKDPKTQEVLTKLDFALLKFKTVTYKIYTPATFYENAILIESLDPFWQLSPG